jgi:hypothetical protein
VFGVLVGDNAGGCELVAAAAGRTGRFPATTLLMMHLVPSRNAVAVSFDADFPAENSWAGSRQRRLPTSLAQAIEIFVRTKRFHYSVMFVDTAGILGFDNHLLALEERIPSVADNSQPVDAEE